MQRLLRDEFPFAGLQLAHRPQQPLLQLQLQLRLDLLDIGARFNAAHDVQPIRSGKIQQAGGAVDERLVCAIADLDELRFAQRSSSGGGVA